MIRAARWIAIAIAIAAIVDPRIPLPRSERPVVRVLSPVGGGVHPIAKALKDAGFVVDPSVPERATVLVASNVPVGTPPAGDTSLWALDTSPPAPNVSIREATTPAVRLPAQAVDVRVVIASAGVAGQTTELVLEQSGIPVANARHTWTDGEAQWTVTLRYLPPTVSAIALRVRASGARNETSADDNAADVAVPAVRGPIRVLIVEAAVTWPAVFVRRALEGEPAVTVSSLQRAAKAVTTRAGNPPPSLTRSTLAPFEAVVIGGPDELRASDLDALRWFIEQRGGSVIFIPDRAPSGQYVDLLGVDGFKPRALETPAGLGPKLQGSDLLIPTGLPAAATILAALDTTPVVFSIRRGNGAVVFSGALDAWRQRGDEYGEFWRGLLLANAASVPPALQVNAEPAIARPGEPTRITARMRDVPDGDVIAIPPLRARVISPEAAIDEPIRLWPTAEPGVFEGEWRGHAPGMYNVSVSTGELRGDATVTIASSVIHASAADSAALALAANATGGRAVPAADMPSLIEAMKQAHPPQRVVRAAYPMRSPWWIVPFAALLCAEWGMRRKRGLP
jgi:hypothetical protein